MKRQRKKYQVPKRPWDRERIEVEKEFLKKFGLKKKRELWRTEALLRKYRRLSRELIGKKDEKKEKILIEKLANLNILPKDTTLDNVLSLTVEDFLNRRLQTIVHKKNLANSPKQARQFITHGQVLINGRKIIYPGYMVPLDEEERIIVKTNSSRKSIVSENNGGTVE